MSENVINLSNQVRAGQSLTHIESIPPDHQQQEQQPMQQEVPKHQPLFGENEYLNEIIQNFVQEENTNPNRPNFFYMDTQTEITSNMRSILLNWIFELCVHLHYKTKTFFKTIWIVDSFLSVNQVPITKLQLVGLAAFSISSKENEIYFATPQRHVNLTDNAYTVQELNEMEILIMKSMNYDILLPTLDDFFGLFEKCGEVKLDKKKYFMILMFLEFYVLCSEQYAKFNSWIVVAACFSIVYRFTLGDDGEIYQRNRLIREICPPNEVKEVAEIIREKFNSLRNSIYYQFFFNAYKTENRERVYETLPIYNI